MGHNPVKLPFKGLVKSLGVFFYPRNADVDLTNDGPFAIPIVECEDVRISVVL